MTGDPSKPDLEGRTDLGHWDKNADKELEEDSPPKCAGIEDAPRWTASQHPNWPLTECVGPS